MPNWERVWEARLPKRARQAVWVVAAVASVAILIETARTCPIPRQAICVGCAVGVVAGAANWIGNEWIGAVIDWAAVEGAFVLGLHFYPAALRESWIPLWQLTALMILPTMVVISAMEYFGLWRERGHRGTEPVAFDYLRRNRED